MKSTLVAYGCTNACGNISNLIDSPSFAQCIDGSLVKARTKEEGI